MEKFGRVEADKPLLVSVNKAIQRCETPLDICSLEKICFELNIQGHLAILTQPYLNKIIIKDKTIESRFTKPRIPPYKKVKKGDVLFLKLSGGPLLALALISEARFFGSLSVDDFDKIINDYKQELALEKPFEEAKRHSKYGTLIFLDEIMTVHPMAVKKSDRRSWVILNDTPSQPNLF